MKDETMESEKNGQIEKVMNEDMGEVKRERKKGDTEG